MEEWEGDLLKRKVYANFLTKLLVEQKNGFVLNLNSPWGTGKTFFLNKWIPDLKRADHITINYNAWECDYLDDPLVSFVANFQKQVIEQMKGKKEIDDKVKDIVKRVIQFSKSGIPTLLKGLVDHYTGEDGSDVFEQLTEKYTDEVIKVIDRVDDRVIKLKEGFDELVELLEISGSKMPIFIFIDELDRCRPDYAIELLESVKHLFYRNNLVFIIATDTTQLGEAVKGAYGASFDGNKYLRRFFDREYKLPEANLEKYVYVHFNQRIIRIIDDKNLTPYSRKTNAQEVYKVFFILFTFFELSLRDVDQILGKLEAILLSLEDKSRVHFEYLLYVLLAITYESDNSNNFSIASHYKKNIIDEDRTTMLEKKMPLGFTVQLREVIDTVGVYQKKIGYGLEWISETVQEDRSAHLKSGGIDAEELLKQQFHKVLMEDFESLNGYVELSFLCKGLDVS